MSAPIESQTLRQFDEIFEKYNNIEQSTLPTNAPEYQSAVKEAISKCECLVHEINRDGVFSTNEDVSDINTPNLRFLLLPALMGYFTGKLSVDSKSADLSALRGAILEQSETYYKNFIKLCRQYSIRSLPQTPDDDQQEIRPQQSDAYTRKKEKVVRYKSKKLIECKLEDLYKKVANSNHIDESEQREYYLTLIDQWILNVQEELDLIRDEKEVLEHMSKLKSGQIKPPTQQTPKPLKPFILTKTELQKQVFGAGYPSLPTYSLDDFYEAQVRAGQLPAPGTLPGTSGEGALTEEQQAEQEEIVKEYNIETDDSETLQKARDWDDWKDDHRRGWGNRKNMG